MAEIFARTWKSAQLATQSTYFPPMVRAAAAFHRKTYSDDMVAHVAAQPSIVDAIHLNVGETVDTAILSLMTAGAVSGQAVDKAILDAVAAYVPPPGNGAA